MPDSLQPGGGGAGGPDDTGLLEGIGDWMKLDTSALEDLNWKDYSKVGTGGLIAWGAFASDLAGTALATIGYGISSNIVALGEANAIVADGLTGFVSELYFSANPRWAYLASISSASAELKAAGPLAFILATIQVIVMIAIARKAWEVVFS